MDPWKIFGIVVMCIIALGFTAHIAWTVHLYYFNKEVAATKVRNKEMLQKAIDTKDISYCKETTWESGCVVRVGQKWNDVSVCGNPGNMTTVDENFIFFCHAAVLNNVSMCSNLSKMYKGYCKDYVEDRNRPVEVFD